MRFPSLKAWMMGLTNESPLLRNSGNGFSECCLFPRSSLRLILAWNLPVSFAGAQMPEIGWPRSDICPGIHMRRKGAVGGFFLKKPAAGIERATSRSRDRRVTASLCVYPRLCSKWVDVSAASGVGSLTGESFGNKTEI